MMMVHVYHLSMVVLMTTMWNYDSEANIDDNSCIPFIYGCTDSTAFKF